MSRCTHSGLGCVSVQHFHWGEDRAICGTCTLSGPWAKDSESALRAFWDQERIRNYKDLYYWFKSVGFKNIQDIIRTEVDSVDFYRQLGASLEIKYMPIEEAKKKYPETKMPNPTPYWIIVSDEGHAAIPAKHLTKEAADAEAKRLTAAKPGVNFTVFEAKYSLKTPKAEAVKTTYETSSDPCSWGWNYPKYYNYFGGRYPY
jgi:hypothetical protein